MSLRSILRAAAPVMALAVLGMVQAAPAEAAGDPARGKTLGWTCLGCHGIETYKNVYPTYSVPKLRGQHAEYLVTALKAYRSGERSHGTMHAHAASLSDQDIEDVAAYLAGQPVEADQNAQPRGNPPAAVETCKQCHGTVGVGIVPAYPTLTGQHADYLAYALESYRNGTRKNGIMQPFATMLKPEDIPAIAEYFSKQAPTLHTVPLKEKDGKAVAAR
ncbi:MAG: c-type cytochrome [Pseudomonadota bacterium]|jgi:cytochrome c553|nr:MAG: cytochrome c family protein [Pseudomonadota bacterium]